MFGTNKRYKKDFVESPYLVVNSVFATIQGEGPYAGSPAIFVRLSHCNLACTFCDTEFEKGEKILPQDLMKKIRDEVERTGIKHTLLVITGGEPMLQDMREFFEIYRRHFPSHQIQIETAGTVWRDNLEEMMLMGAVDVVCSPKTPTVHPKLKPHINAWKYIVKEGWVDEKGLPYAPTQPGITTYAPLARPSDETPLSSIYIQPVDEQDEEKNKRNIQFARDLVMKHGYKLSLQLHKMLDLP